MAKRPTSPVGRGRFDPDPAAPLNVLLSSRYTAQCELLPKRDATETNEASESTRKAKSPTRQIEKYKHKSHRKNGKGSDAETKGFSLIELLIVVAIILIIAAIAIPNLMRAKMAANDSSAAAGERAIVTAKSAMPRLIPRLAMQQA